MTAPSSSLDRLRREIDEIDDAMHDLLMRRAEVVLRIGAVKERENADIYIRPGREAAILRRLVARHRGPLPAAVVVRIWREMLAATTRLQGPFAVAVQAPEKSVGYWDLARDHYGSSTRMTLHRVANLVLRAVVDGTATIGVLALPEDGEADPWWRHLADAKMPRVVSRLPFIDNSAGRFEHLGALAIARLAPEPTGDDVSLAVVETAGSLSRASVSEAAAAVGLSGHDIAVWVDPGDPNRCLHLLKIAGFVGATDPRLDALAASLGERAQRVVSIGGYAVPIGDGTASGDAEPTP